MTPPTRPLRVTQVPALVTLVTVLTVATLIGLGAQTSGSQAASAPATDFQAGVLSLLGTPTPTPSPGAFRVSFLYSSPTVPCGNRPQLAAIVTDAGGVRVPNGTIVSFATDAGVITPDRMTNNGVATAGFTAPETPGQAHIVVSVGGTTATTTLQITCTGPSPTPTEMPLAPAAPIATTYPPLAVAPEIRSQAFITAPNTGSAGLGRGRENK